MASWRMLALVALVCALCVAVSAQAEDGEDRISPAVRYILNKRKPSIGLSLAEYMAEGGKGDSFHFLPSRRSEA